MGTAAGQPTGGQPNTGNNPVNGQGGNVDPAARTQQGQPGGGQGGQSTPQQGQGGVGTGNGTSGGGVDFDRSQLDPVLRDMNPTQINEFFNAVLTRFGNNNQQQQQPEPQRQTQQEEPEPDYKSLLDPNSDQFNPQKAFGSFVEKNYGNLIKDINTRSVKGLYGNFRNRIHDFGEYEADIDKALGQRDPSTLSEKDIFGTYLTMKGMRQFQKEQSDAARQAGSSTHPPSPAAESNTAPQVDETEKEFARTMFPNAPDPVAKYQEFKGKIGGRESGYQLDVPIDGTGKKG